MLLATFTIEKYKHLRRQKMYIFFALLFSCLEFLMLLLHAVKKNNNKKNYTYTITTGSASKTPRTLNVREERERERERKHDVLTEMLRAHDDRSALLEKNHHTPLRGLPSLPPP